MKGLELSVSIARSTLTASKTAVGVAHPSRSADCHSHTWLDMRAGTPRISVPGPTIRIRLWSY